MHLAARPKLLQLFKSLGFTEADMNTVLERIGNAEFTINFGTKYLLDVLKSGRYKSAPEIFPEQFPKTGNTDTRYCWKIYRDYGLRDPTDFEDETLFRSWVLTQPIFMALHMGRGQNGGAMHYGKSHFVFRSDFVRKYATLIPSDSMGFDITKPDPALQSMIKGIGAWDENGSPLIAHTVLEKLTAPGFLSQVHKKQNWKHFVCVHDHFLDCKRA